MLFVTNVAEPDVDPDLDDVDPDLDDQDQDDGDGPVENANVKPLLPPKWDFSDRLAPGQRLHPAPERDAGRVENGVVEPLLMPKWKWDGDAGDNDD